TGQRIALRTQKGLAWILLLGGNVFVSARSTEKPLRSKALAIPARSLWEWLGSILIWLVLPYWSGKSLLVAPSKTDTAHQAARANPYNFGPLFDTVRLAIPGH
ncbi:hypothetical protein, partial [Pseudomonas aeruginosa]|uniref:hypothetical protein n=1 Tax=Pseudomonas aeruginosa TaxID=287 RepID=UPI001ABC31ED